MSNRNNKPSLIIKSNVILAKFASLRNQKFYIKFPSNNQTNNNYNSNDNSNSNNNNNKKTVNDSNKP